MTYTNLSIAGSGLSGSAMNTLNPSRAGSPAGDGRSAAADPCRIDFVLKRRDRMTVVRLTTDSSSADAWDCWVDMESQHNSMCLGVICSPGLGAQVVSEMISDGVGGAAMPGAIAVLGHDLYLQSAMSKLASELTRSSRQGHGSYRSTSGIPFEWPPIAFLVQIDDPSLMECARTCRSLNGLGIPAQVDILPPQNEEVTSAGSFLVNRELEEFFERHLIGHFPKML